MTHPLRTRTAIAVLAGLAVVGALAGCSSSAVAEESPGAGSSATNSDPNATYTDGTYTSEGHYNSPGGPEIISVELTLASNVVTAVKVETVKADPTATQYEAMFKGGVAAIVVGKNINELNVARVAGSSLTSMGFADALTKIKADAKS